MASGYCVFIVVCVNHPYRVRILNYTRDKLVLLLFHNLSCFFFSFCALWSCVSFDIVT